MDIELEGAAELIAKLSSIRQNLAGPEMEKAVRAGARVIRKAMTDRAPVLDQKTMGSTALDPGSLKAGIRSYLRKGQKPIEALIGPSLRVAYVARFVEYGHRDVHGGYSKVLADGKLRGSGVVGETMVPAHPFLRPAFESSLAEARDALLSSLQTSLKAEVSS